ncbi:Hypothetical protein AKI40_2698 [Enterobacter sp. FY-07]|nr:Hypothetical protein AKI40_2698 [Enterobacter sp. FY-07]
MGLKHELPCKIAAISRLAQKLMWHILIIANRGADWRSDD